MLKNSLWIGTFLVFLSLAFYAGTGVGAGEKVKKGGNDDLEPKYKNTTFVPTADEVIDKMFELAKVNKNDVIFDLGCGDNRIIYKAAKKYGCRGIGVEINPERIRDAMKQYEKYNGGPDFSSFSHVHFPRVHEPVVPNRRAKAQARHAHPIARLRMGIRQNS
jgi:hypothetical protein